MGVLKNLTEEYFGESIRTEEAVMEDIIKNDKRKLLLKMFEKESDKKKNYMVFRLRDSISDVLFFNEMHAGNELLKRVENYEYSSRGLCKEILLATEETYEEWAHDFDKLPDGVKDVFREIFKLYTKRPVLISSYLCCYFNPTFNLFGNKFPTLIKFDTMENFPQYGNEYDESDECVVITLPTGRCNFCSDFEFINVIDKLIPKLKNAFEENGYIYDKNEFLDPLGFGSPRFTDNFLFIKKK